MHRVEDPQTEDPLIVAFLELMGFVNDPRQDWRMMAEAGLDLDPVFLPLLVRLGSGPAAVVELAGRLGRDHSTMSRQLTRLEAAGLVERSMSQTDGRVRVARLTAKGKAAVAALSGARRRLLDRAIAGWRPGERETLGRLMGRLAEGLKSTMSI